MILWQVILYRTSLPIRPRQWEEKKGLTRRCSKLTADDPALEKLVFVSEKKVLALRNQAGAY